MITKLAIILVLLGCGIHVLNAATCNNPLKSNFNFTGPANSANVTGITVCKSLQNKESCCDLSTFNSIQTKANTLLQSLRDAAAARDVEITNVRLKVLPGLTGALNRINNVMNKSTNGSVANFNFNNLLTGLTGAISGAMGNLTGAMGNMTGNQTLNMTGALGNLGGNLNLGGDVGGTNTSALLAGLTMDANSTASMNTALQGLQSIVQKMPNLKDNFMSYQKNRTKCVVSLVKLQAAAWCLACDPDYASKGVSNSGSVNFSTTVKDRLQNNCYDYFAGTEEQSKLLDLQNERDVVEGMAGVMEKLQNLDMTAGTDMQTVSTNMGKIAPPSEKHKKPAKKPANCTRGNCTFIFDTVFRNLQINTDVLGNGGVFDDSSSGTGRLLEEDFGGRVLQSNGDWNVDEDEAGVSVTFDDDPGNANSMTASASLIKGALVTFAAIFLALLF